MYSSKWNYVLAGFSGSVALLAALTHQGVLLVINLFFTVFNWYLAENKRQQEDNNLIDLYEFTKETMAKLKDEEPK
jgi:hypothetical protein